MTTVLYKEWRLHFMLNNVGFIYYKISFCMILEKLKVCCKFRIFYGTMGSRNIT